jgi:tuberculosinol/isotuberculosinol synthase
MTTVSHDDFQAMPTARVAGLVRQAGSKVCVFPINGTRRWYMLELGRTLGQGSGGYVQVAGQRHLELYSLLFNHGLDTLLTPVFGPDLLERGDDYMEMAAEGLSMLASDPAFLAFYEALGVRVRFYGDYVRFFEHTPHAHVCDQFDEVSRRTAGHERHRLFFGVCAHEPARSIAELSIAFHAREGRAPEKQELVEGYYGEPLGAVDLFIGFDKLCAFDMPLVATGNEDLYFTVSPSPYLNRRQLRDILYDHLYARGGEPDYEELSAAEWAVMRDYYQANLERTLGVGTVKGRGGVWYPLPQVVLPQAFDDQDCTDEVEG